MELNKTYFINVICQINRDRASFIVVEKFCSQSTEYYLDYHKQLLSFNQCGSWFENLDTSQFEEGRLVLVQTNKKQNLWARGIISKLDTNNFAPEIYLIDSQRFFEHNNKVTLRICPPKFLQLLLPSYNIDLNFSLDSENLKILIEMLIDKNQQGEISFCFTPRSIQDHVYYGELIINNKNDNSFVPLKTLLKNVDTKKCLNDIMKYKQNKRLIFNPVDLKYLRNLFVPKDSNNLVNTNKNLVSSYLNISNLGSSLENLTNDSVENDSSTLDFSEYSSCSNDSVFEVQKTPLNCKPQVEKQNVNSFCSSPSNTNNFSFHSIHFKENKHNYPINRILNNENELINQNTEKHHDKNENKLYGNMTKNTASAIDKSSMLFCSPELNATTNDTNDTLLLDVTQEYCIDNKFINDMSKEISFFKKLIKKRIDCLSKFHGIQITEYQLDNLLTVTQNIEVSEISSKPKAIKTKNNSFVSNTNDSDTDVWWSSDDEN